MSMCFVNFKSINFFIEKQNEENLAVRTIKILLFQDQKELS